jgi:putative cardiolipin synthase
MKLRFNSLLIILIFAFSGCATLKEPPPVPEVFSMEPAATGILTHVLEQFSKDHASDESGFLILSNNKEAFEWRLALVDEAVRSIDAQYFIWQNDETGILLFDRLLKAADRGVRIRLLVDDIFFAGKDRNMAAIALHPNFDIKIFNPGNVRNSVLGISEASDFLLNFKELNRRMHNKLLVVDNRLAIVGGRNIGNAYFGLSKKYNFRDLDVLVTGPVIPQISAAFDVYWNVELAYPGSAMSDEETLDDLAALRKRADTYLLENKEMLVSYPSQPISWRKAFLQLPGKLLPGKAQFIQDKPVPIGEDQYRLLDVLDYISEPPARQHLIIVSPYLIPTEDMLEKLRLARTAEGVKVSIVTASMGANNHTAAHSHYKKYRRKFLEGGAELFEVKHDLPAAMRNISDVPPVQAKFISLHVKAMVADRKRCFVGSLNLDPRALELNTENGLYIESHGMCAELADQFETLMHPDNSWRVYLNEDDQLRWESSIGTVSMQPARSFGQRISDFFFRLLPLEGQL